MRGDAPIFQVKAPFALTVMLNPESLAVQGVQWLLTWGCAAAHQNTSSVGLDIHVSWGKPNLAVMLGRCWHKGSGARQVEATAAGKVWACHFAQGQPPQCEALARSPEWPPERERRRRQNLLRRHLLYLSHLHLLDLRSARSNNRIFESNINQCIKLLIAKTSLA